jgi:acyl-Coa thioesterase superfamily protein/acyl-CoA thioesterase superfamily protein
MTAPQSFFVPDGDRFIPTELTRGPWSPFTQHGGPPSALVGTLLEMRHPRPDAFVGRVTFEILRPIPIAPLTIATRVVRPGKRVELLEAIVSAGDDEILRASAWRVRIDETVPRVPPDMPPVPPPAAGGAVDFFPTGQPLGYHTGMEGRFVRGGFVEPGPATAWMRMRYPVLPGVPPSPLARVLCAADSGNGVSSALDFRKWMFINTDLSVYLHRPPAGEWICLDARTTIGAGVGLAESAVYDEQGPIGRALQCLYVGPQPG